MFLPSEDDNNDDDVNGDIVEGKKALLSLRVFLQNQVQFAYLLVVKKKISSQSITLQQTWVSVWSSRVSCIKFQSRDRDSYASILIEVCTHFYLSLPRSLFWLLDFALIGTVIGIITIYLSASSFCRHQTLKSVVNLLNFNLSTRLFLYPRSHDDHTNRMRKTFMHSLWCF